MNRTEFMNAKTEEYCLRLKQISQGGTQHRQGLLRRKAEVAKPVAKIRRDTADRLPKWLHSTEACPNWR